jgi:hypothetical protein
MSSLTDTIATLNSAQKYLYQFACPILMLIGTVGCILNLIVFTQKNLRKNPCSIYFIAYNIANFVYIYSSLLALTLSIGYNLDASKYNLVACRLRLYTNVLSNCLSAFYLILASIDRILVSSPNALTRQRSTQRFAYLCIFIGTLFWASFHCHALIFTNIVQLGPSVVCYFQLGVYLDFISYYALLKEMLALSLLTICGLWSIKNIRNSGRRVRAILDATASRTAVRNHTHSTSSKDRQLILMLLMDIGIYTLFSIVFAIFLLYQQITQNYVKSLQQIQIENIVRNLCLFDVGI